MTAYSYIHIININLTQSVLVPADFKGEPELFHACMQVYSSVPLRKSHSQTQPCIQGNGLGTLALILGYKLSNRVTIICINYVQSSKLMLCKTNKKCSNVPRPFSFLAQVWGLGMRSLSLGLHLLPHSPTWEKCNSSAY